MSIMERLAKATDGESYRAHKYDLDRVNERPSIEYDEPQGIPYKSRGERESTSSYVDLTQLSRLLRKNGTQLLKYFLDGSRRVFKVDDIAYGNSGGRKIFYPVIAGQVGIACCRRDGRTLTPEKFEQKFLIVLPNIADADRKKGFWAARTADINRDEALGRLHISFEELLQYSTSKSDVEFEDRGVAKIMSYMSAHEQTMVAELVRARKLDQYSYLVKDGSLQYLALERKSDQKTAARYRNNYRYVIGVSKSFNPDLCLDKSGKPDHGFVAKLPLHHRTVSARYTFGDDDAQFAIWYVRLRDKHHTRTPFDGIVKVEKLMTTEAELKDGVDPELINMLSALLINERNPVCYGSDLRWANHIYPIFLTESFVKSKYISTDSFLQLF